MFASNYHLPFPKFHSHIDYNGKSEFSNPLINCPLNSYSNNHYLSSPLDPIDQLKISGYESNENINNTPISENISMHKADTGQPYSFSYGFDCMNAVLLFSNRQNFSKFDNMEESGNSTLNLTKENSDIRSHLYQSKTKDEISKKCPICMKTLSEIELYSHFHQELSECITKVGCNDDDEEISVDDCEDNFLQEFRSSVNLSTRHQTFLQIRSNRIQRLEKKNQKILHRLSTSQETF